MINERKIHFEEEKSVSKTRVIPFYKNPHCCTCSNNANAIYENRAKTNRNFPPPRSPLGSRPRVDSAWNEKKRAQLSPGRERKPDEFLFRSWLKGRRRLAQEALRAARN
ncbi:hypothetical protein AVEN_142708-1 [Araneus ventricosus]|uniref:Uncharacterized protein n=1 Tax=Araneus ventricosus TaxID=182803 RepID=A0A4Y2K2J7_ARAVE|nr:hypothetical protein AVEN_142708-1 [Araneus ventricosus]